MTFLMITYESCIKKHNSGTILPSFHLPLKLTKPPDYRVAYKISMQMLIEL